MWGCTYNGAGIGHWFFGGGIMGFLIMALIIVLITTLVIKLVRSNKAVRRNDTTESLTILQARFANGEITEQEYKIMKSVLGT
jgi:putative membrane protein